MLMPLRLAFILVFLLVLPFQDFAQPVVEYKSARIPSSFMRKLCPTDFVTSDKEFGGNGPQVWITANLYLSSDKKKIHLKIEMDVEEYKAGVKGNSEANGSWETIIAEETRPNYQITHILTNQSSSYISLNYLDTDIDIDVAYPTSTIESFDSASRAQFIPLQYTPENNNYWISSIEIVGDTEGNDIGGCGDDAHMVINFSNGGNIPYGVRLREPVIKECTPLAVYPSTKRNRMSQNLRGVTHDDQFWYFTQEDGLWKIPVGLDLNSIGNLQPENASRERIPRFLGRRGYKRFGDMDHYGEYLYVALEGDNRRVKDKPQMAVFKAEDLSFEGVLPLDSLQTSISFVAVSRDGNHLYTGNKGAESLLRYPLERHDSLGTVAEIKLYHHTDDHSLHLDYIKGGAFSADGRYLFLTARQAGSADMGIWSFNTRSGRVMSYPRSGMADQVYSLTYWDDVPGSLDIPGPLHLIQLNEDGSRDAFSFRHFGMQEVINWAAVAVGAWSR